MADEVKLGMNFQGSGAGPGPVEGCWGTMMEEENIFLAHRPKMCLLWQNAIVCFQWGVRVFGGNIGE